MRLDAAVLVTESVDVGALPDLVRAVTSVRYCGCSEVLVSGREASCRIVSGDIPT